MTETTEGNVIMKDKKQNKTQKSKGLSTGKLLLKSVKVIFRYLPASTFLIVLIMIFQGLVPVLNVYLIGKAAQTMLDSQFVINREIILWGILVAVSMCLDLLCSEINHLLRTQMSFRMEFNLRNDIIRHVEKLDIRYREKGEYHTIISRASQAISPHVMFSFLDMLSTVVSVIISLAGVSVLLFRANMIIPFINLIMLFVAALFTRYFSKKINRFYEEINPSDRLLSTADSWFNTENTNAEMRIFRSVYWFRKIWSDLYSSLTKKKNKFSDKIELQQGLVNTIFTCLPVVSILIYLMMPNLSDENVAADTINIFNSCTVMTTSAVMLSYSFDSLSGMLIKYENYFRLFAVESPKVRNEGGMSSSSSVELDHVSFCYHEEKSTCEAVQDVSVKFESGKVYALVGCNGSGKTTLAKLIMKLYRPSKGTVKMLDGNGKETDLRTSTVMQDFMRYDVTLKENITFGDFEQEQDGECYQKAIQNSESGSLVKKIGEDTILGTRFGEVNLSGGEWQRVAVARGFFRRESAVVVFDEPNSSIDAIAESKIIKNMIAENRDKICIFITHRLASVKFADQILVMKDGKLIEQGTHHQLIDGDTEYNRMFSAQVEWYQ